MMNIRDSLVRTLHKCSGPADTRGAAGTLEDMTVGERALAHHALLAETRVDEEQGLDGNLVTGTLPTHSVPMVHAQKVENDDEVDPDVRQQLCHKLAHPLQLLMGVKQELKVSDSEIHVKEERKRVRGLPEKLKKKNRKQHSPAKILTVSSNGSLGLQSTKAHMCEHCNATFRTNYHLQRHLFIHTGEKPFQCSQCDMRFIQKYLLQRHEKIHTGEKPFCCDECGMKFIQKYHMERHKRTHSGEKPYQCDGCLQYFSRTDRVLKHKRICQKSRDCKASRIPSKDRHSGTCEDNSLSVLAKECSLPEKKRRKSCQKFHEGSAMFSENGNSKGKVVQRLCKKAPLYAISPKVSTYMVAEYSVEQPPAIVPPSWGSSAIEINPPKFVLKKVLCKQVQKPHLEQIQALSYFEDGKATRYTFELVDKQGLLDVDANTDLDPAETLHAASSKSVASSTNYDDAVQFLKKKRYLQGATSSVSRGYTLNLGSVAPQSSTPQAALSTLPDDGVPTVILDAQTLNVGIKSNSAKTLLPDEVLQTLLDHYSNKGTCQPKISFSVANAEVPSNVSVDSLDLSSVSQPDTLGTNSEALPAEKSSMLREYSKFLQQALERTSQNDLNSHSLAFAAESPSLSCQPLFSSFDTVTNRFQSGINSPLRASSEKSHFGLLAGDSHNSMSFSGDETNPSSVSSSEDFLEKVTSSKKSHAQVIHQTFEMSTFEQNLYPQFQSLQSGTSSQFSTINGQENLRGLVSGTFFPEFPMVTISKARTQLTSSPDDSSSQTFD